MGTITLTLPVAGTQITAGLHSGNYSAIQAAINGDIENVNIKSSAAIAVSKLAAGANGEVLSTVAGVPTWSASAGGGNPTGTIIASFALVTPSGYLLCDGSSQSRTTYATLFSAITLSKGTFTVTIASPAVFTNTAHGLKVGEAVYLTTTGALPTGLAANTTYYVTAVPTADTFRVSASRGGADINTSGSQSGTHTLVFAPAGVPDASNFWLPDPQGRALIGQGTHVDVAALGDNEGQSLANRTVKHNSSISLGYNDPGHSHTVPFNTYVLADGATGLTVQGTTANTSHNTTGITFNPTVGPGGTRPTDEPANLVVKFYIKT